MTSHATINPEDASLKAELDARLQFDLPPFVFNGKIDQVQVKYMK